VVLVLAFATSIAACSGKSSSADEDEDGGSGGSGVTGGTSGMGGSSGTAGTGGSPRPPKLGLNLMLKNPSDPVVAGSQCPASSGVEWDIGVPELSNGMVVDVHSPTPTDFGSTLADGELDTDIACSVTLGGVLEADGGGVDPMITPPSGRVNFTLSGTASLRGGVNLTGFSVYTPVTFQLSTDASLPSCVTSAVHEVAPGALWADIACPALVDPTRPGVACQASGTIVLEYCETE
jgi:hypothetical protein